MATKSKAKKPAKKTTTKKKTVKANIKKPVKKPVKKVAKKAPKKAPKKVTKKASPKKTSVKKTTAKKAAPQKSAKKATAKKPAAAKATKVTKVTSLDSFKCYSELKVGGKMYGYYDLNKAAKNGLGDIKKLPFTLKILLENLLRHEDGRSVTKDDIKAVVQWLKGRKSTREIAYRPARVLMQDFTGVPAVVDLAAMRDAMTSLKGDAKKINPLSPVDLVIDHSVMVDVFANKEAFKQNVNLEFRRNNERYEFLKWGQKSFDNFRVVPPGTGICHQVNLEYLSQTVWTKKIGKTTIAYPDTLVGTDSHTTMVNGLAVLGWGVGGIEAEAAMLGQPISMLIPEVVGFKLDGKLREGVTATDLVLTVTQMLRAKGVVGKFVEFYGPGLDHLSLADRATIANMAPEYGATCGFFPVDDEAVRYLTMTGRAKDRIDLVKAYSKKQGLWRARKMADASYSATLSLDMSKVVPSLAGPKRPQDRLSLQDVAKTFPKHLQEMAKATQPRKAKVPGKNYELEDGAVVIAAITSCTNTSNPSVMIGAGLVARKARAMGLSVKPWVKTSLAPGSQVVTDYLNAAGLQKDLDALGFNLVGYGCTTCIGNSGPLPDHIIQAIEKGDLVVGSVLSGNRNFEGRVNPHTRVNYLASPPLVVAYALAGNVNIDLAKEPVGHDKKGKPVYLKDIWPSNQEIQKEIAKTISPKMFKQRYSNVFKGTMDWQKIRTKTSLTYGWNGKSTYVKNPPYFERMSKTPGVIRDISRARVLALLGDSITTDHISPAGSIKKDSPAGSYLQDKRVTPAEFNSYGARRGNHEIMMRGTFANIRLQNEMVPGKAGGYTKFMPAGTEMSIYDAAMQYQKDKVPLVIIAGKEYGTGSSRDWAAKGTNLLGVKAVIAESFERIHRSNLVGMGVLPLQFPAGVSRQSLKLDGSEVFDIVGLEKGITPRMNLTCKIQRKNGKTDTIELLCRIDTVDEVEYYRHGGILPYVIRNMIAV